LSRPRLFLLLDRAAHAVRQQLERRARDELGVGMVQIGALFHLASQPGCRSMELAEALGIQPAGASTLVDRMEGAGLVRRRTCEHDARAQRLFATAAGTRVAARARPIVAELQARLAADFTEDELAIVARFLATAASRNLSSTKDLP
jgi:MarR family transcriptional regulator, organic hydroperoxide resistance regulator